ncbi:MAG: hypothetical protein RJA26_1107 [Actinomycetota bacterium]
MNRLHTRFTGDYQTNQGTSKPYRAADPDLLLWVHMAFMESFLVCHEWYAWRPIPGGADAYISQWSRSVKPLGLETAPLGHRIRRVLLQRVGRPRVVLAESGFGI